MGEHHKQIKPNATVRFNVWLLASRVSESLESSFILADKLSQWIVEGEGDGHKQARLEIIRRLVAEKQSNQGYSAEILEMAESVEAWIGTKVFEQLAKGPELYRTG